MREIIGDIWAYYDQDPPSWICITTNGVVKANGELVMGKGVALEAKMRFPEVPGLLGRHVKRAGNVPCILFSRRLISFPTKNNWGEPSSLDLIEHSAQWLRWAASARGYAEETFYLPRPGCGNGQLSWFSQVRPLLLKVGLPNNVVIVVRA